MAQDRTSQQYISRLLVETDPERALIGAIFRCALVDLHAPGPHGSEGWYRREDALRWWRNKAVVTYWLTLAGLPASTYDALAALAGVGEEAGKEGGE